MGQDDGKTHVSHLFALDKNERKELTYGIGGNSE
jgi:hypothetical protein